MKDYKIPLSKGTMRGGLKDTYQEYNIYFLDKVIEKGIEVYSSKISLEHMIVKDGVSRQRPTSLRFTNEEQLKSLIHNLIKALVFWGKNEKTINQDNFQYKMIEIKRFVDDCFRADTEKLKVIK